MGTIYTQADLDAIDAAIKSNTKTIRFQDQSKTYRSIEEMMETRAFIYSQLNPATSANAMVRQVRGISNKGVR